MSPMIILLEALSLSNLFLLGSAQVLCTNPLVIGELWNLRSKRCVDIRGDDGEGSVQTYKCDGREDQQIILCGDGTIRNERLNFCFTPNGKGNAKVNSKRCIFYPQIPKNQRWRLGRKKRFYDNGGIKQEARKIINMESGKCLDVQGTDGTGKIQVYKCENKNDQYFYFRSRGKQIAFGRLINEKSRRCLDVSGSDGKGNVKIYKCEDKQDQWFRFYENGEVVNEKSKRCLDVSGSDGTGNIQIYYCEDKRDQMWSRPKKLCNGDYCSFVNKRSNKCLDVSGKDGKGGVKTYDCEGLSDQRFKWEAGKWTPPKAKWFMVGCNKNGKVSHSITNSVAFGSTVTKTVTIEVASSIESALKFGSVSVSTTVSSSLSTAWTKSHSEKSSIHFACEFHDNGAQFKGGCMWQLQVDTKKVSTGKWLTWKPQIVRCTSSDKEPSCPPFTKCTNKGCTRCKKM